MARPEFAIIGTAEVPCGHYPQRNEFEIAYTVARDAARDAGISMDQIGGVVTAAHIMGGDYNTEMLFFFPARGDWCKKLPRSGHHHIGRCVELVHAQDRRRHAHRG